MVSSLTFTVRVPSMVDSAVASMAKPMKVQARKQTDYKIVPGERPISSLLSDAEWTRIQSMVASAKSLRTITRIVLCFFKDYEMAQMHQKENTLALYPVAVPISEVYALFASRKRRVYDVLHILEGVGILKRTRGVDVNTSRFRSGHYLFFGKRGALEHLRLTHARAEAIVADLRCNQPFLPRVAVDQYLVQPPPVQDHQDNSPDLTSMTVSVLSLLLGEYENRRAPHSLNDISRRLLDASAGLVRQSRGKGVPVDVNRRIYDIVSVLATLNVANLLLREGESRQTSDKKKVVRKDVAFNHAVFSNADLIRVGDVSSSRLEKTLAREATQLEKDRKTQLLNESKPATRSGVKLSRSNEQDELPLEDLFPCLDTIDEGDERMVEWWNVPLRDLLLHDALQGIDFLDWEIMQAISRARSLHADKLVATGESIYHEEAIVDLACYEALDA